MKNQNNDIEGLKTTQKKPLTVYKASAGSGKTFTLAIEYIKLLIVNPYKYRNILAVTFTNKATEEMKMRILSQLYGIWKLLPDSQSYIDKVCEELGVSTAIASKNAGIALELLLHNYNHFRVETIDSFFQSVLRNLARELDLPANLRVGLNGEQVESQAVDKIVEELNANAEVLQWIMTYINESISEDHNWNVISDVKEFGKNIFKDFYKHNSKALDAIANEKNFFENFVRDIRQEQKDARERMVEIGESFFETIEAEGLDITDFSNGAKGVAGFFVKLRAGVKFDDSIVGKTVSNALLDSSAWVRKTHPRRTEIIELVDNQLLNMLKYGVEERGKQWRRYQSATVTLQQLNQLRLLTTIEKKVRTINEDANRFLLSDTQHLLHSVISDSDSPFIFEKIGSQLNHIMIDEFQDTSVTQWLNFKVLLEECMSQAETMNLIVGDVKQSIYRWRSGDWRLLNNIKQQFANADQRLDIHSLDTNYRSTRNVIDFNNAFFTFAQKHEYEALADIIETDARQLTTAYEDVCQKVPESKKKEGYVNIKILPQGDYVENTLKQILDTVRTLEKNGIPFNKTAILVREKSKYIPIIAKYFMDNAPDVKIVSAEAFRLDASLAVNVIVQALHLLTHPNDSIAKAFLAKAYQQVIGNSHLPDNQILLSTNNLDDDLPEEYVNHRQELLTTPLYDLAERIYAIFHLDNLNDQSAYVCAFFDQLSNFIEDTTTDIDAFIEEWESEIAKKTIQSDEINGIRIVSVHASKGLEFDNVIIPFCSWKIERNDTLWAKPTEPPYNRLPIVPVKYNGSLKETVYEKDYLTEKLQLYVDNLNLLYVAFTRAKKNLFVISSRKTDNKRSKVIVESIPKLAKVLEGSVVTGDPDNTEQPMEFTYGELVVDKVKGKETTENVFLGDSSPLNIAIERLTPKVKFMQSNKSADFIDNEEDEEAEKQKSYINIGNVLHNVLSNIRTLDDIDSALLDLQESGLLYDDIITPEKVKSLLRKRLNSPEVKEWFSPKWKLFNECNIVFNDPKEHRLCNRRPDRVMLSDDEMVVVDYKFAAPSDEHVKQVTMYKNILSSMGYKNVKGYLWYVYPNNIVKV